jgi:hypothetical protein
MHRTKARMPPRKEAVQGRRHARRSRVNATRASHPRDAENTRAKSRLAVDGLSSPDLDQLAGEGDL